MMRHYANISLILIAVLTEGALPVVIKPQAGPVPEATRTWTTDDLEQLKKTPDQISVVGQPAEEGRKGVDGPSPRPETRDSAWYAEQAASLNARRESQEADLRDFQQKIKEAQESGTGTPGINLDEADPGVTPEATIEILQDRVRETQSELDALEDLARHDGIPPGTLRGQ